MRLYYIRRDIHAYFIINEVLTRVVDDGKRQKRGEGEHGYYKFRAIPKDRRAFGE